MSAPAILKEAGFFESKPDDPINHLQNSLLHDSIIICRWRELNLFNSAWNFFFFQDWQTFICKWFYHAINLRSNRLTMVFLSGFRSCFFALHEKWPHVLCQLRRFVNDAIQFDVNISIELNAHCAQTQCCDPRERFWANLKATDGWIEARIVLHVPLAVKERSMKVTLAMSSAEQSCVLWQNWAWCLIALLAYDSTVSKLMRVCLFSCIVVRFQYFDSHCAKTTNSRTHSRIHTSTQTLRNE